MNLWRRSSAENLVRNGSSASGVPDALSRDSRPTVIITGPPWPRSGTGRVMQSQIQFYRKRGYNTVFIAVPFRWNYTRNSPVWDEFRDGLNEMGADYTLLAAIEPRHFTLAKFSATLRYKRRGTALDWLVAIGRSTQLTSESFRLLKSLPVVLCHVNHVFSLGFALRLKGRLASGGREIPVILDTHDIQSHMLHEKQEPNPWTGRSDTVERLLESEVAQLRSPNALIHLSVSDFDFFRKELPGKNHFLALPTIAEEFVSAVKAATPSPESIDLLFVAHWHPPNLTAIQWFFDNVWPSIANRGYKLRIVGRIKILAEGQAPELFEKFRQCFVGEVVDLAPYYRSARCVIAPMISGSGISIKTIEAFALGKAFVGTAKAFRGMPMERLEELGVHAFDEPQAFADAIVAALSNPEEAERTSQAAYDALFSTEACFAVRDESLNAALQLAKADQAKAR